MPLLRVWLNSTQFWIHILQFSQIQGVVHASQAWLHSSWHVQVPFTWLEACVEWLQQEGGAEGHLSQQHINKQVLDQWLLTDLRDLGYPVLPEGLSLAHKTELSGTFCVQVDSLLDISQPAYGQLQKWKGTDCANEEVSAVTQFTQKPWEARPTRMLLLQVTDGVQCLEAMEYQPIPALSTSLRPGVKLQLQGQMLCRLGVLLLRPANVKVLGGEVEDMVNRNSQGRVLCRTLGLREESQPTGEAEQMQGGEQVPPEQGNQEFEEFDDEELLASLEVQEDVERAQEGPSMESGYGTLSAASISSYRSSSVRSHAPTASSRSDPSPPPSGDSFIQIHRNGLIQGHCWGNELEDSTFVSPFPSTHVEGTDNDMADDFPDEDFDDLPLDELDSVIFQGSSADTTFPDSDQRSISQINNRVTGKQQAPAGSGSHLASGNSSRQYKGTDGQSCRGAPTGMLTPAASNPLLPSASMSAHADVHSLNDCTEEFLDEDMYSDFPDETETGNPLSRTPEIDKTSRASGLNRLSVHEKVPELVLSREGPGKVAPQVQPAQSSTVSLRKEPESTALMLNSSPFTYLCLFKDSQPQAQAVEIQVKAFIVTLLSKLSSSNGTWRISATISDGTGYLDVDLSDEVLTQLLGFSVAEKGRLKRDPSRRAEQEAGMKRCQEGLVDMCCLMTVRLHGTKAVVTRTQPFTEEDLQALEQRLRDRRR